MPPGVSAWTRLWSRLFAPVDGASVVFARIAFGVLMTWEAYRYLLLGRVEGKYAGPPVLIPWSGLEWIQRWPGDGLYWHFYALGFLALCLALGFCTRAAAALFCLGFCYVLALAPAFFQNHFYLICLLSGLFVLLPSHGMASVDVKLRPRLRSDTVPAWALWCLRGQLGIVYFYGGIAKIQSDWLQGYPLRIWLAKRDNLPVLGWIFEQEWMAIFMSWSGLAIDLFAFPALVWRRTRPFAFAVLVSFHLWNSQLFSIGVFPWMAIALTTIFFEPDWPRRIFRWPRGEAAGDPGAFAWTPRRRALAGLLTAYVALQLLLPLRQHLYAGDTSWTDQGQQFAWRMMLRSKTGLLTFRLTDPETGESWLVDPSEELDREQYRRMSTDPPMIHVYARRLAELASEDRARRVQVRALVIASLNGREPQPLIDPEVDLAAVEPGVFARTPGILPYTKPLGDEWRAKYPAPPPPAEFQFD